MVPHLIPKAELIRFFDAHFPNFKCVICKGDNFGILGPQDEDSVYIFVDRSQIPPSATAKGPEGLATSIAMFECSNCHYIYRFNARPIERWLENNPK
jgi:hypothetical protein